jgi:lysine 6-dehydrogenase
LTKHQSKGGIALKVFVVGGAGAMGMVTVRDLVESPEVSEVMIADANLEQAEKIARWSGSAKAIPYEVDVYDHDKLVTALHETDAVASATPYHLNLQVMDAAIEARKPLTDLGGVYYMTLRQLKLNRKARNAGVTIVLGGGLAPGIADVLAKYGADKLDTVQEVHIHYGERNLEPVLYKWSFRTVLEEYTKGAVIYSKGKFRRLKPFSGKAKFMFPHPIGELSCCYALYSGLATLPHTVGKGVETLDCAMAFTEEDERRIHILKELGLTRNRPLQMKSVKVSPREFLLRCVPPPRVDVRDVAGIVVEVAGEKNDVKTKYSYSLVQKYHEEYGVSALAYLTGVPMSIIAQMLARGEIPEKGVLPAELGVNSAHLFEELAKRGITILEKCQTLRRVNQT